MKVEEIKINAFGTLKNKEINLSDKINIIHGKNESGKSTLLTYIKTAFYGIESFSIRIKKRSAIASVFIIRNTSPRN